MVKIEGTRTLTWGEDFSFTFHNGVGPEKLVSESDTMSVIDPDQVPMSTTSIQSPMRRRRKPIITYHSPPKESSHGQPYILRTPPTKAASQGPHGSSRTLPTSVAKEAHPRLKSCSRHPFWTPSRQDRLPLYHPLGRFAVSLPPLNPAAAGLPMPEGKIEELMPSHLPTQMATEENKSSISSIQPEGDGRNVVIGTGQKRRSGGNTKRKRKDPDDGDNAYPARRVRGSGRNAAYQYQVGDDEEGETKSTAFETAEDLVERRLTRSRGPITQTDSALSDAPSINAMVEKDVKAEGSLDANMGPGEPNLVSATMVSLLHPARPTRSKNN